MTDWMEAAREKLKEVGEAIAQDVQVLLDEPSAPAVVTLPDGSTKQVDPSELEPS